MSLFTFQQKIPFKLVAEYLRLFEPGCSTPLDQWCKQHVDDIGPGDIIFMFQPEYSPWNDSSTGIGVADGDSFKVAAIALIHKWDSNGLLCYMVTDDAYQRQNLQMYFLQQIHAAKSAGCGFYYAIARPTQALPPDCIRDLAELESFGDSGWRKDEQQPIDIVYAFCTAASFAAEVQPADNPDIGQMGYCLFCDKQAPSGSLDLRPFVVPVQKEQRKLSDNQPGQLAAASNLPAASANQTQLPKMPSFFSQLGKAAGTGRNAAASGAAGFGSASLSDQQPAPEGQRDVGATPPTIHPSDLAVLASPAAAAGQAVPETALDALAQPPAAAQQAPSGEEAAVLYGMQQAPSYWQQAMPLPVPDEAVPPPLPQQAVPPPLPQQAVPPPLPQQAVPPPLPQQAVPPPLPQQAVPVVPIETVPAPTFQQVAPQAVCEPTWAPPLPQQGEMQAAAGSQAFAPGAHSVAGTSEADQAASGLRLQRRQSDATRQADSRRAKAEASNELPPAAVPEERSSPSVDQQLQPSVDAGAPLSTTAGATQDMHSLAELLGTIGRSQPDEQESPLARRLDKPASAAGKPAGSQPAAAASASAQSVPTTESRSSLPKQEPVKQSAQPLPVKESAQPLPGKKRAEGDLPPERPLKEPLTVKSGVAGLVSKLEQQASKASSRLESQVDEIQERLTEELTELLAKVGTAENRSVRNAHDLRADLTEQLNKAASDVTGKIADSALEGSATIKHNQSEGDSQLREKHEYVRTAVTNSLDEVKARAEALGRAFEDNLKALQDKQLEELLASSSSLGEQLGSLNLEYEAAMNEAFNAFHEKLDSANQAITNTVEGRYALLQEQLVEINKRARSGLSMLRTAKLHKLQAAFVAVTSQLRELSAASLKDKINPRLTQHREEMRLVTAEFQDKLSEDLAQKGEEKLCDFDPIMDEKRQKLMEVVDSTAAVKDGIEQQLQDKLQATAEQLKRFVEEGIETAQTAYAGTEEQLSEIDRTLRALADPSTIEGDLELLNERNQVLAAMDDATETAKDEVLGTLKTGLATLEEKGKQLQEELISSMEEDAYRVRRAAEQALSSIREAIKNSFIAIQSAQDERMPM